MREFFRLISNINELCGRRKPLAKYLLLGIFFAFFDLFALYLLGKFFSSAFSSGESQEVIWVQLDFSDLAIAVICIYIFRLIIGVGFLRGVNRLSARIESDLKVKLLKSYQELEYEFRLKKGVGELADAINNWTSSFARSVVSPLVRFTCESVVSLTIFGYFCYLYPRVTFLVLGLAILVVMIYDISLKNRINKYANEFRRLSSQVANEVQDGLVGYKEIYTFNLTDFFLEKIKKNSEKMCFALAGANLLSQVPRLIIEAFLVVVTITILWFSVFSGGNFLIELPGVAVLGVGLMRIASWFSLATSTLSNLRVYRPIVHAIQKDINSNKSEILSDAIQNNHYKKMIGLTVEDLCVGYGSDKSVFYNMSFHFGVGDKVLLWGPSGSGKTTLIDTLFGLIKPRSGRVVVKFDDGSTSSSLLGLGCYISQNTFIINDTLRRNVALGVSDLNIDDSKIIKCLTRARLLDYASVEKLDMSLGDSGARLSGGQRQRVVIARALYLSMAVLIVDEATSGIDEPTESEIISDMLNLDGDVTLILVSHRPNVAEKFSRKIDISNFVS